MDNNNNENIQNCGYEVKILYEDHLFIKHYLKLNGGQDENNNR